MYDIVSYLSFFTFGLGMLFCLYLIHRFKTITTTRFLVLLILCLCYNEFYMYALGSKIILDIPIIFRSAFPPRMLFGPLLYLYTTAMLFPEKKMKWTPSLHFVPTLIIIACLMPDYLAPTSYKLEVISAFYERNSIFIMKPSGIIPSGVLAPLVIIYGLVYCLASFWKIYKYKKTSLYDYANNSQVVRWILLFQVALIIYLCSQFLQFISLSIGQKISSWTQLIQSVSLLSLMAYLLINKEIIENMDGCLNQAPPDLSNPLLPEPIEFSNLLFVDSLDKYFTEQKPFLDPDFSLSEMAKNLGYTSKKLSHLLHQTYGVHFNEWVNRHRINYLIEIIEGEDHKHLKLEALIYQAGFQYRSSFYVAFKKIMKNTPSAFFKKTGKEF
jgi:AraC-like DNA-binding protein